MSETLIKLPFDGTGTAPGNLCTLEPHTLVNRLVRAAVPDYGAFFAKSLVVVDAATNLSLTPGVQFKAIEQYNELTKEWGQSICSAVLIIDSTVSNNILITYQALGGEKSYSTKVIQAMFAAVADSTTPLDYKNIIGKPDRFVPTPGHLHDSVVLYGMEFFTKIIADIKASAALGDGESHADLYNFITTLIANSADDASMIVDQTLAAHVAALNPHPQYARTSDIGSSISAIRKPVNVTPSAAAANVLPTVLFQGSPYYTFYGVLQQAMRIQISTVADFSTVVYDVTLGAVQSYQPPSILHPSSTYYWRIQYEDIEGFWTDWSQTTTFSTSAITVAPPTITSPANGSTTNTQTPGFTGSAFAVIGDTDTQVAADWEIWTGPNGTGILAYGLEGSTTSLTTMMVPLQTLQQNTQYYVRVRYKGAKYGYSNWSPDVSILSVWPLRPTVLGQSFGGGFWGGDIVLSDGTYAVIVAPKATGEKVSVLSSSISGYANQSLTDSVANTAALPANGATAWARALTIGGFTDWCIPAANVMTLLWTNLRASATAAPAQYKTGGSEAFTVGYYWTSSGYNWTDSETSASTPNYAWVNHVQGEQASGWYGSSSSSAPTPTCNPGTVSNVSYGYFFSIDPSTGQPGSLNTTYWQCTWQALEVVSYTPGQTTYTAMYDGYIQYMGTSNSRSSGPKNTSDTVRAVRLVKVA